MVIKELLDVIDASSIKEFHINEHVVSYQKLSEVYGHYEIDVVQFRMRTKTLQAEDVQLSVSGEDIEDFVAKMDIDFEVPDTGVYTVLTVNINIKGGL